MIGADRRRDGERGILGHSPILARRGRLFSAAIARHGASQAAGLGISLAGEVAITSLAP